MYREKLKQMLKSHAVKDIWRWSEPVRLPLVLICLLTLVSSGGSLVITLATKGLIDGATEQNRQKLIANAILLTSVVLAIRVMRFFGSRLRAKTNATLLRHMRLNVFRKLLHKQYAPLSKFHSGELVNRMFSDVNVVKEGILSIVPSAVSMLVSFCGAAVILISMDWRFVILLVVGGIFGTVLTLAFREPMKKRHKAMQESEGRLHAFLQESLGNIRIIKASGSEERMQMGAETRQTDYYDVQMRNARFSIWMNAGIGLTFQLSWLFCMLWGGFGIYRGTLTYGSLAAVIQLVNHIQMPIANAAGLAGQAYGTVSSAERLAELLDLPEEEPSRQTDRNALYSRLQSIRLNHVTFSYGGADVLRDLDATVNPGDFVALTGISGGGKSTLFQLLLGIYQPTSGGIEFVFDDGVQPANQTTRQLFGYVPQGNYLFSGTIRENLSMFTDKATDDELMEAARLACIDDFINGLQRGLDTVLGEHGLGLSEGQAQRIAIARSLLSSAPILLLDESTSALDEETEAKLLSNLSGLRSKTCFIVTHRRAALEICDYRLHLEKGNVRKIQ